MNSQRRILVSCLTTALLAANSVAADETLLIGGEGAYACSTSNSPATLADGITPASAELSFHWDGLKKSLYLTVRNTSPVTEGVPNPLITEILFNLPEGAISSMGLVGQVGPEGSRPNFSLSTDFDLNDGRNWLMSGCMGAFGARLDISGLDGAIANPDADTLSGQQAKLLKGSVTFEFAVDGPGVEFLSASAFSSSLSLPPSGGYSVNASLHFQAGGYACASDKISSAPGCNPGGWIIGVPRIGNLITFNMTAAAGCHGCMAYSNSPGPTRFGSVLIPLGPPIIELLGGLLRGQETTSLTLRVPNDPSLVGVTFYLAVAAIGGGGGIEVSDSFSVTVLP